MDSISDELIMKWAERAIRIIRPFHSVFNSAEHQTVVNILHYQRTYDPNTQMPWTQAQKRKCVFYIMSVWYDLELGHYC
jgi:hypothetical protein